MILLKIVLLLIVSAVIHGLRLPQTSRPLHYDIEIVSNIHLDDLSYQGIATIEIQVLENTNMIILHKVDLTIISVKNYADNSTIPTLSGDANDFLMLTFFTRNLDANKTFKFTIEYSANLRTDFKGFYVSSYQNSSNAERKFATTNFQPTKARMAFPCYDEPEYKATFKIQIVHGKNYSALSNTKIESIEENVPGKPDYQRTIFKTTPKMSTYLVAFIVSDFTNVRSGDQQVFGKPGDEGNLDFALEFGNNVLSNLSQYLNYSYWTQMEKIDQVAVPKFTLGGMENWGLVIYSESSLQFNPNVSTYSNKFKNAKTIAHEFSHQWFGDLVTCKWWDYLWLNEGFATLFEYIGVDLVYPEWNVMDFFTVNTLHGAFFWDSSNYTQPMTQNISTSHLDIGLAFNPISYSKSASVLRMFQHVFGNDNFKEGLNIYLNARKFDSVTTDDLSAALEQSISGKNLLPIGVTVKQIMDSWTTAKGFPILNVERNYTSGEVIISQQQYFRNSTDRSETIWWIPINYATASLNDFSNTSATDWLSSRSKILTENISSQDFVIFNKQQTSYYRVNYDLENWKLILAALVRNHSSIHYLNRAQLLEDAFELVQSERLNFTIMLDLLKYLEHEIHYVPWTVANNILTYLSKKLLGTKYDMHFNEFMQKILPNVYKTIAVDQVNATDTMLDKHLQTLISSLACNYKVGNCLENMQNRLKKYIDDKIEIHQDIRPAVYCHGMRSANETEFVFFYHKLLGSKDPVERKLLINSLACSYNETYLKAFFDASIGSSADINLSVVERLQIHRSIADASSAGLQAIIEMFTERNVTEINGILGPNTTVNALSAIVERVKYQIEFEKLTTLVNRLQSIGEITVEHGNNTLDLARNNFMWETSSEGAVIGNWFESNFPQNVTVITTTSNPSSQVTDDISTSDASNNSTVTTQKPSAPGSASTSFISLYLIQFLLFITLYTLY
uniref:Aminopeptidase n=1 Tax=Corethrella appendiculata TaxID=1370023 RepID=U5EJD6_9DIPT